MKQKKQHTYGMKMRPFGIGCQPMSGLTGTMIADKRKTGYWSVIYYDRELTEEEIEKYELVKITP